MHVCMHAYAYTYEYMHTQARTHVLTTSIRGKYVFGDVCLPALQPTATPYNPLQQTTTHCNTLQQTATHCNTLCVE